MLFSVKLYVGLSSNSISIFSDAVNNMFDSLSGLVTFICLMCVASSARTDADPDDVYAYAHISFQADADSAQIEKAVSQISEECAEKTGIRVNVIR